MSKAKGHTPDDYAKLTKPKADEFIDFRLCGSGTLEHPVYKWLVAQMYFQRADRKFCTYKTGQVQPQIQPGSEMHGAQLEFAQRLAYCIGQYLHESTLKLRTTSSSKSRKSAAADYKKVLRWLRNGFAPYHPEDRTKLEELLLTTIDYVQGKHISAGFETKAGKDHGVRILIRSLAAQLDYFDLDQAQVTSIIIDLLGLVVVESVDTKTVQRNVKIAREYMMDTSGST